MSHWRRVVLVSKFLVATLILIVFLTRVVGPAFNIAEDHAIATEASPFFGAYMFFQDISFILIVPIIIVGVVLWLVFGPAQEELQKERRRRGL